MKRCVAHFRPIAAGGALLLLLGGCATGPVSQAPPPAGAAAASPSGDLAGFFSREARRLEKDGLLRQSLDRWRIAAALQPEDGESRQRVTALESELTAAAKKHFEAGRSFHERGNVKAARREFLLALTADPDHAEALRHLRERLEPATELYTFKKGDTLEDIAARAYGNRDFAVLLKRLNRIDTASQPAAGQTLILPLLEEGLAERTAPPPTAEVKKTDGPEGAESAAGRAEDYIVKSEEAPEARELSMAREHFEAGNFEEAIYIARLVPAGGERGEKARRLADASYLGLGRKLQREKRYGEALEILAKADQSSEDVKKLIAEVEKSRRDEAEEHYLAGIRFFIDQKLADAISEWEQTLALDPEHPKARKDLDKALKLSEQLQKIR